MRTAVMAVVAVAMLACISPAYGYGPYLDDFRGAYPAAVGSRIDNCVLCHVAGSYSPRNPYGVAYAAAGHSFTAIADDDSDGDTYGNAVEIDGYFYPGDAGDHPAPPADTLAPVVTVFDIPPASDSLTVPITGFTATDDGGVTGFLVTESATKPAADDTGWQVSAPGSYTAASDGPHTLYGYARDAAGNVSDGRPATVTITLPASTDTTPPTVSDFRIPATSDSLTVPVLRFVAGDDTAVTGYLITESSTRPDAGDTGWLASAPGTYTAASDGTHTLYAYARDAAGNVSDGSPATVTITLARGNEPLFFDDFADATSKGDPDWERVYGRFIGQRGAYVSQGRKESLALARDEFDLDPFRGGRIETDLQGINPSKGAEAGILFDYQDREHYRYVLFNSRRQTITIGEVNESDDDDEDADTGERKRTRRVKVWRTPKGWHHLTVDVDSATGLVRVYLDAAARPALTMTFASVGQGRVGIIATDAARKAAFDNFKVSDMSALP